MLKQWFMKGNHMYTEEDSERTRAAEHSSAGRDTQRLAPQPSGATGAPVTHGRNNGAALVLVAVGVFMLLSRALSGGAFGMHDLDSSKFTGGMILFTIASCFLFFSFWRRVYGLLIPGCILAGLGIGVPLASLTHGTSVLWGLALGFFAIFALGRALFGMRTSWPVIPAVIFFAVGAITAIANLPVFFAAGIVWLPLLLIAAGLYLGWGRGAFPHLR
jgi:hypothetical protein